MIKRRRAIPCGSGQTLGAFGCDPGYSRIWPSPKIWYL